MTGSVALTPRKTARGVANPAFSTNLAHFEPGERSMTRNPFAADLVTTGVNEVLTPFGDRS